MKSTRTRVADGLRWLMLATVPADVRAGREAVEWLLADPVFTLPSEPEALKRRAPARVRMVPAVPAS